MARALWTGSISFGLVNVPVRLYSAISEHKLHFHFVHEKDESPIGYQKICKVEEKPVPEKEIVKAFEYRKGKYVYMEEEDFEAARVEGYKTIDITDFVPNEQIDPIYFAHTYYVGPQDGAEKVYSLLVKAMEDSELAGIAKFVMRDRQYLGALRVREGVITLEQLHFADEIRPVDEIKPKRERVDKRELEMAQQLIDSFTGEWKPEKYTDEYSHALMDLIHKKLEHGGEALPGPPSRKRPSTKVIDLVSVLQESLEHAQTTPAARKNKTARKQKQVFKKAA